MKRIIQPCLQSVSQLVHKPMESLQTADFASVYLNRDWYLMLQDCINERAENLDEQASPKEIFEMQRVGMLRCLYRTTATNLFKGASEWFAPVRRLEISHERYSFFSENWAQICPESPLMPYCKTTNRTLPQKLFGDPFINIMRL
jgi:hypothetical protein